MANISHFTQTVNGVSTTYDIHDADAVPRSGGAVIAGTALSRTVNDDEFRLDGGTAWNQGASLSLSGKDRPGSPALVTLHTSDGTDTSDLLLRPNGIFALVTNGTLKHVAMQEDVSPTGSYIQFAGSQAPAGFLVCNGGEISRTTYSALFAVIGTTYGSGNGSTTFNLPNLIDRFLQGSTTSGTVKNAGLPNIEGNTWNGNPGAGGPYFSNHSGPFGPSGGSMASVLSTAANTTSDPNAVLRFDASTANLIYGNSTTVQPPALTCLICIKY